jgi:hypothetical protein
MSLYAIHLANGKTANTSPIRLLGRLLSGTGVIESTAFTVSAQGTPTMTLNISGSTTSDNLVIITATGDVYHGWNTSTATVTISSNATGVSKRDAVVAYVDTALTSTTPDNPGGLVLTTVRGSGTDTVPTDAEIDAAVSSKPWIRLANIFVANGASSINSGNITDTRVFATVDGKYLKSASVTPAARTGGFKVGTFTSPASTGSFAVTGVGFKPKGLIIFSGLSSNSTTATSMFGAADSTSQFSVFATSNSTSFRRAIATSILNVISTTDGSTSAAASLSSFDSDGFTLNFTTAAASTFYYMAFA